MNKRNLISLLISMSILSSCMDTEKNKLDNRVIDYWTYKINKDYEAAYEFLSPGWKGNEDREAYALRMKNSTIDWKNVKIVDKICSETYLCEVSVEIEYEYMFKEAVGKKVLMPSTLKENWLMKDNIWYNVPIKSKIKSKK